MKLEGVLSTLYIGSLHVHWYKMNIMLYIKMFPKGFYFLLNFKENNPMTLYLKIKQTHDPSGTHLLSLMYGQSWAVWTCIPALRLITTHAVKQ